MDKLFEERYREAGPGWRALTLHEFFGLLAFDSRTLKMEKIDASNKRCMLEIQIVVSMFDV